MKNPKFSKTSIFIHTGIEIYFWKVLILFNIKINIIPLQQTFYLGVLTGNGPGVNVIHSILKNIKYYALVLTKVRLTTLMLEILAIKGPKLREWILLTDFELFVVKNLQNVLLIFAQRLQYFSFSHPNKKQKLDFLFFSNIIDCNNKQLEYKIQKITTVVEKSVSFKFDTFTEIRRFPDKFSRKMFNHLTTILQVSFIKFKTLKRSTLQNFLKKK